MALFYCFVDTINPKVMKIYLLTYAKAHRAMNMDKELSFQTLHKQDDYWQIIMAKVHQSKMLETKVIGWLKSKPLRQSKLYFEKNRKNFKIRKTKKKETKTELDLVLL